jgi:hypothetical protein
MLILDVHFLIFFNFLVFPFFLPFIFWFSSNCVLTSRCKYVQRNHFNIQRDYFNIKKYMVKIFNDNNLLPTLKNHSIAQNNRMALYNMLHKKLGHLGFGKRIIYSKNKTSGKGCNCMFNKLFLNVWFVTKCECHSMHLHLIYNHCPSWDLVIGGVWIY